MSDKQTVIELVQGMPDNVTLEEIMNELSLLQSLREGAADSDAGRVVSHEDLKRSFAK
jgi:predicted transcriptional regulator